MMASCVRCGYDYSMARKNIGYKTCLPCGDKTADRLIREKASRCMPAFNKGGIQYVADITTLKWEEIVMEQICKATGGIVLVTIVLGYGAISLFAPFGIVYLVFFNWGGELLW